MRIVLGMGFVLSALVSAVACGGEEERAPALGSGTGRGGASGNRGGSGPDDGGQGGEGSVPVDERAPIVIITSPQDVAHPNDGEVLIGSEVEVTCNVTKSDAPGSSEVDPTTVRMVLLDAEANAVGEPVIGTPTEGENEFAATLIITPVASGPVAIGCSASDVADPHRTGFDEVLTFVDHGPTITVTTPAPDSAYPLESLVPVQFEVVPTLLADGDDGAAVDEVSLDLNGIPVEIMQDGDVYTANVDFTDATLFPDTPSGAVPVLIRATNSRSPTAVTGEQNYSFVLDGDGPVITVTSHESDDVVGGEVVLAFTVADALSGVDRDSVVVEVNEGLNPFTVSESWSEANGNFTFTFDSRNVQGSEVQITVNITANDGVGNAAEKATLTLWLDNIPPDVDLDAANVREWKLSGADGVVSISFDPLGPAAANDEEVIGQIATYRTLVWEQTNSIPEQTVHHHAGTNVDSVYLYLQPNPAEPLLVDTDDDPSNLCDDLAITGLPALQLEGISPTGQAWFDDANPTEAPDPTGLYTLQNNDSPPAFLCELNASDMTRVIKHDWMATIPAVFAKPELQGVECTGQQWEITSFVDVDGWICLAARAEDNVGNVGVSRPLRLCYDSPAIGGAPACATMSTTPPACTDGCTPPLRWGPAFVRQ